MVTSKIKTCQLGKLEKCSGVERVTKKTLRRCLKLFEILEKSGHRNEEEKTGEANSLAREKFVRRRRDGVSTPILKLGKKSPQ